MITKEQLEKIIQESVNAPSGDNAQPWRFLVHDNVVDIFNVERDQTIFNFRSRGDYIAHGALIENMGIVGAEYGLRPGIKLFPEGVGKGPTARMSFEEGDIEKDPLYEVLGKRATNRKPYKKKPLTEDQKKAFAAFNGGYGTARVVVVDDREKIDRIAHSVNLNERLILENKTIRDFLFSIIRWTKKEEQKKPGMHIRTLELAPPQRLAFRMFKNDAVVGVAKKLNFPKMMEKEGAQLYSASGAIGAIVMDDSAPEDFMQAGRLFERVWLTATATGFSMQPLAAIPYLAQRIKEGSAEGMTKEQADDVLSAEKRIREALGISDRNMIAMLFRMGEGSEPSAYAAKLVPEVK